ncbi:MAG: GDP-mannose 4,6-dehydratase [Candidatus Kerfeldbacteria bacterium]|nr:GDP-mannose 4,6-dehydratase [Candidatus Kerfeldbacteria bacterium]
MKEKPIFERKNILVTGGAGFVGSHLCDELIKHHKVICFDNFITGAEENINHLLKHPDFEFVRHDMSEPIELETLPELRPFKVAFQGIQEIYNLACPTSPKDYRTYPTETLLANAFGTKYALDLAVKYGAKILHVSTSAIYGEPLESTPFPENYWGYIDPIGPRSAYNEGKRFSESLVINYRKKYHIDAKIVRMFNTFGPRMRLTDGRMIPDFVNNSLANDPLVIYGAEDDRSTYCYITDMIEGLLRMMKSNESGPTNLGNPQTHRITDVAQLVIKLTNSRSAIRYEPHLPYTVRQGIPNIQLAKEKLGWFPVVPLEDGLLRTIDYLRGSKTLSLESLQPPVSQ